MVIVKSLFSLKQVKQSASGMRSFSYANQVVSKCHFLDTVCFILLYFNIFILVHRKIQERIFTEHQSE